jgi:hypothetical protein
MRKADDIWREIATLPFTPRGLQRRLDLIAQLPPDEQTREFKEPKNAQPKQKRARKPNDYHGLTRRDLERWRALRQAGIVVHLQYIRGHRVRVAHLAPPIRCRQIPKNYTGKLNDKGPW